MELNVSLMVKGDILQVNFRFPLSTSGFWSGKIVRELNIIWYDFYTTNLCTLLDPDLPYLSDISELSLHTA